MASSIRHENRLIHETSPYLRQHAHNPVDWYAWGDEALSRARREDKPILLSIGYAACHWCHVMERESFEDERTAALMNEHYVCIKVDREERPDLDDVYMAATIAMTGQGGWPMTVFLTPEQKPFFAGTYFPPEARYGRPSFATVLTRLAEAFQVDRSGVEAQAQKLTRAVTQRVVATAEGDLSPELPDRLLAALEESFDETWGGFSPAPKFPQPAILRFLLRHHVRTGSERALHMAKTTLDAMKNGGMYDQLSGGFARYSTDERWQVPHFEKMLYDNAQLARVYTEAFQLTREPEYGRVVRETLDYALRELQSEQGGFYSATDADSEGVEGKFFTFSRSEVEAALSPSVASLVCAYFDIREAGNWESTNVLWTPRPLAEVATELGLTEAEAHSMLEPAKTRLLALRNMRVPPLLDDKILVSWNGLMISALAEAARVLDEPRYRLAAERAAQDLLHRLRREDGGLFRTARGDRAQLPAYLEDYACLGDALVDLYEAGSDAQFLATARMLATRMIADFRSPGGGAFYQTSNDHQALIARVQDAQDGAMPSANAMAAQLCARLYSHFADDNLHHVAQEVVYSFGQWVDRAPRAFVGLMLVSDLLSHPPLEIAVVGTPGSPDTQALTAALAQVFLPQRVLSHGAPQQAPSQAATELPLLQGKGLVQGAATAYVCQNFTCSAPITTPAELSRTLHNALSQQAESPPASSP